MQKTKKSIAKRFKVTGTGKIMRRSPGHRHLLTAKSTKQKRRHGQDQTASAGISKIVRKGLPHSKRT